MKTKIKALANKNNTKENSTHLGPNKIQIYNLHSNNVLPIPIVYPSLQKSTHISRSLHTLKLHI